jgi:hypothetical protein
MQELQQIYYKHKSQLLPIIFGFSAFFVIFRIILPQWSDIQDAQQLMTSKGASVEAKQSTITLLNSIPQDIIDSNYDLVTKALPTQKDIILIYSELTDAATNAGVTLGGFSLRVGSVYSAGKKTAAKQSSVSGIPLLNMLVTVSGTNENVKQFADILYKSSPLIEIKSVDISKSDARYDVNFYFKPVGLLPDNIASAPLKALNASENSQMKQLKAWQAEVTLSQ